MYISIKRKTKKDIFRENKNINIVVESKKCFFSKQKFLLGI